MQFVEVSVIGVRSARLIFSSPTSGVRVTLFPMIHVGEPEFYRTTYADAQSHDVILLEGVRSPVVARITRSYRWIEGSKNLSGLVIQPRFPDSLSNVRIVHADFSQQEFEEEWRKVSLWLRFAVSVLAPLVGLNRRWRSSRSELAKTMSCEDQPSVADLLAISPETGALTQAILHARDQRLIERLGDELDAADGQSKDVAIIYGAAHMRAVVRELTSKRNFSLCGAEWRTIMNME
jgi:hypothetical protein